MPTQAAITKAMKAATNAGYPPRELRLHGDTVRLLLDETLVLIPDDARGEESCDEVFGLDDSISDETKTGQSAPIIATPAANSPDCQAPRKTAQNSCEPTPQPRRASKPNRNRGPEQ